MPTQFRSPFRDAIERMEEHEIIHRLAAGQFSEDAKPVAEAVLRARGVDPDHPVVPADQQPRPPPQKQWKPRALPIILGTSAAAMAGGQIGAVLGGVVGAPVVFAVFFSFGWWIGGKLAHRVRAVSSVPARLLISVVVVAVWLFAFGFVGVLARALGGTLHP